MKKDVPIKIVNAEVVETKKEKVSKKINVKAIVGIGLIVVVVLILFYFLFFAGPCAMQRFVFNIEGVTYCSNTNTPSEFFSSFRNNTAVYISPVLVEGAVDNKVVNAMFLWQVVLLGNDINAIQLVRVNNSSGELLRCTTNYGDVLQVEDISKEECLAWMEDSNRAFVLIEEGSQRAVLENNKLTVFYSDSTYVGTLNFRIIKNVFPNAEEILQKVNQLIYNVG